MAGLKHPLEKGTVVSGKYRIEGLVGQGGMATIYRAHHDLLQREVAIKILTPELAEEPEIRTRFLNEARAAAKLKNEHVAAVMDVDAAEDGTPFIVLEYLEGEDLESVMAKRGPLPHQQAVDFILQALEAIAHAHSEKIIHRDLKPANLFLTKKQDGTAIIKVFDFGLAKIASGLQGALATKTTAVLGSPTYMPPEQLRSAKSVDPRADLWAVGVILFHLVTGKFPFTAESDGELFATILADIPPATLRSFNPDLPEALEKVCAKCLERDLAKRYANAAELAQALGPLASAQGAQSVERICRTLGIAPPPPPAASPAKAAPAPLIAFANKEGGGGLTETTVAEAPSTTDPMLAATTPHQMDAPKLPPLAPKVPAPAPAIPAPPPSKPTNPAMIRTVGSTARKREVVGMLVVLGIAAAIIGGAYAYTQMSGASAAASSTAPPTMTTPPTTPATTTPATTTEPAVTVAPPPVTATASAAPNPVVSAEPAVSTETGRPHPTSRPARSADITSNPLLMQRN